MEADKGRISQVISNLLSNALRFTEHGKISITTEKNDNHMVVSVKDTGTGIDYDLFPRLFSNLFQNPLQEWAWDYSYQKIS